MPEFVTLDRLRGLLYDESIPMTHRVLWLILWQSDLRLGDLLSVDVRDVDWEARVVPVDFPKTAHDPRHVRISEQAIDGLRKIVGSRDSGPLFASETGGPLSREAVTSVARRAGVSVHGFRLGGQQARADAG
ncbi:tyrosine-type recombinase/integrase [Streptomyces sp. NPDC048241]|uniref:tyrosine-type recombinase/integrase n=1 Tax=Streptomyces sp. NPDC048241 TaxID=3365521 RepID=UPI0037247870